MARTFTTSSAWTCLSRASGRSLPRNRPAVRETGRGRGRKLGVLIPGLLVGLGEVHAGPWPRPPRLRLGSPRLALAALTAPHRVHPAVQACAWLPIGRENHESLYAMVHVLQSRIPSKAASAHLTATAAAAATPGWLDKPTWVVAVDYDSGRKVVFGRPGAPLANLARAVAAP